MIDLLVSFMVYGVEAFVLVLAVLFGVATVRFAARSDVRPACIGFGPHCGTGIWFLPDDRHFASL